jgi:hypothetical protein
MGVFICSSGIGGLEASSPRFSFQKVVDQSVLLPGALPTTQFFEPSLEDGLIAFQAYQSDGVSNGVGIYSALPGGPITRIADTQTLVPGTTVPFGNFSYRASIDSGRVALSAIAFPVSGEQISGAYVFANGELQSIADNNTAIPSGNGSFQFLFSDSGPSADAGQIAFSGSGSGGENSGIYFEQDGFLALAVSSTAPVPGSNRSFSALGPYVLNSERLAFLPQHDDGTYGVYLHDLPTGLLTVVANTETPLPGGPGNFVTFGGEDAPVDLDDDTVVFVGGDAFEAGVYRYDIATGMLDTVAAAGTPVPDVPGAAFDRIFENVAIDDGRIAFRYGRLIRDRADPTGFRPSPYFGIYTEIEGEIQKVLAAGDMLDGRMVRRVDIDDEALDGNQIAILVGFSDLSEAIYVATSVPEPSTIVLIALVCTFVILVRCNSGYLPRMELSNEAFDPRRPPKAN